MRRADGQAMVFVRGATVSLVLLHSVLATAEPVDDRARPSAAPSGSGSSAPKAPEPAASVGVELLVLHATNDGKGIDPAIGKLPQLGQPPFSAYNTYKLVERSRLELSKGDPRDRKLPDGGRIALTLKETVAPKKSGEPARHQVLATIEKPGGKAFLPKFEVSALAGELFFVAGQQYQGGILVIGLRLLP